MEKRWISGNINLHTESELPMTKVTRIFKSDRKYRKWFNIKLKYLWKNILKKKMYWQK